MLDRHWCRRQPQAPPQDHRRARPRAPMRTTRSHRGPTVQARCPRPSSPPVDEWAEHETLPPGGHRQDIPTIPPTAAVLPAAQRGRLLAASGADPKKSSHQRHPPHERRTGCLIRLAFRWSRHNLLCMETRSAGGSSRPAQAAATELCRPLARRRRQAPAASSRPLLRSWQTDHAVRRRRASARRRLRSTRDLRRGDRVHGGPITPPSGFPG